MINNFKLFEKAYTNCKYTSDNIRISNIEFYLEKFKKDKNLNTEDPNYDMLLDDWNGYDDLTYIQNDLKHKKIIYYEGWDESCWVGAYSKPEYKGLNKKEVLIKFKDRIKIISKIIGAKNFDYNYFYYKGENTGFITKIYFYF